MPRGPRWREFQCLRRRGPAGGRGRRGAGLKFTPAYCYAFFLLCIYCDLWFVYLLWFVICELCIWLVNVFRGAFVAQFPLHWGCGGRFICFAIGHHFRWLYFLGWCWLFILHSQRVIGFYVFICMSHSFVHAFVADASPGAIVIATVFVNDVHAQVRFRDVFLWFS